MISCVIALFLPAVLLYGGVFYSGHLFLVSMLFIFGVWRMLSWFAAPFLALEVVEGGPAMDRRTSILTVALLLVAAVIFDGFMASRFDPEEAPENGRSRSAVKSLERLSIVHRPDVLVLPAVRTAGNRSV